MPGSATDIIICMLPKTSPVSPTAGPALLKSHLSAYGFSCTVEDLNIELYQAFKARDEHQRYWYQEDSVFVGDKTVASREFLDLMSGYADVVDRWLSRWEAIGPAYMGFSLLSHFSANMAIYLSGLVRSRMPGVRIVWGGAYMGDWVIQHRDSGLIDHWVFGDAEEAIVELLRGNLSAPGIDSLSNKQFDLNMMRLPDYDDIDWSRYDPDWDDELPVYITGSRGCVKNCTFCNVADIWPTYRYRSGEHIANEINWLYTRYGRTTFLFTDSLINGSMKAFRAMMRTMRTFRRRHGANWTWDSQYIVRSISQSPEEDFELMRDSGCIHLDIGLESFSQPVRYHMGKKFTDEDLWHTLELMGKYRINGSLLTFVGYPTETEEDHQANLRGIEKLHRLGYLNGELGIRMRPTFGNLCFMDDTMPLYKQLKDEIRDYRGSLDWTYRDNTLEVRLRRYEEIHTLLGSLLSGPRDAYIARNIENYRKKARGEVPPEEWNF